MNPESPDSFGIPDVIYAMADDDGLVITLLKRDPSAGMVYRHDRKWNPVLDPRVFEDLWMLGVADGSEGIYDRYETNDQLVTVAHYLPSPGAPGWSEHPVVLYYEPEHQRHGITPPKNYSHSRTVPIELNVPGDLPKAVAAAAEDPDLRWYVERRIAALELDADLPWRSG